MKKIQVAIIGSGNIGTDLMIKILRLSEILEMSVMVGIDPQSDGLARARRMGVQTTHEGVDGLIQLPIWEHIKIVFDATSAGAHQYNWDKIQSFPDKRIVDLTPASIGPYIVPPVNLDSHLDARNVNMVTCGGQATIPIVAAVNAVSPVLYGEIVASIASKSAGPGTRANIDEFTETTSQAIESVGGAKRGKAIIVLNPAEPPIVMRDTVYTLSEYTDPAKVEASILEMVERVQHYVPGYQLHQSVQFEHIKAEDAVFIEGLGHVHGLKTTVLLQVKGAGHYLPEYAGNLDIMTSAAKRVGETMASKMIEA